MSTTRLPLEEKKQGIKTSSTFATVYKKQSQSTAVDSPTTTTGTPTASDLSQSDQPQIASILLEKRRSSWSAGDAMPQTSTPITIQTYVSSPTEVGVDSSASSRDEKDSGISINDSPAQGALSSTPITLLLSLSPGHDRSNSVNSISSGSSVNEIKGEADTITIEELTQIKQEEICSKILEKYDGRFVINKNPNPSHDDVKTVVMEYLTHIWEETIEVLSLSVTKNRVGLYYRPGYHKIKSFEAVGSIADNEKDFSPDLVGCLFGEIPALEKPVAHLDDMKTADKPFNYEGATIFFPDCYTAEAVKKDKEKVDTFTKSKNMLNYFAGKQKCEVIIYLGRDAGKDENIKKREAWLATNMPAIEEMKAKQKFKIRVLTRAELIKTDAYRYAETAFVTKFINLKKLRNSIIEDIAARMLGKNELVKVAHTDSPEIESKPELSPVVKSPTLTGMTGLSENQRKQRTSPTKVTIVDPNLSSNRQEESSPKSRKLSIVSRQIFQLAKGTQDPEERKTLASLWVNVVDVIHEATSPRPHTEHNRETTPAQVVVKTPKQPKAARNLHGMFSSSVPVHRSQPPHIEITTDDDKQDKSAAPRHAQ